MVVAVVTREFDEPDSAKMCQALKSCSVCLDDVTDCGARSTAKLECGHHFHLDCIGSAFNAKGAMQCPNCRHVENGRWLFASGARRDYDFPRWGDAEFSIEEADDEDEEPPIFPFLFDDANDGWDDFSIEDEDPMEEDDMEAELPFEEPEADDRAHDYEAEEPEEDDHEVLDADPGYYAREYVVPELAFTFEYEAEESDYEFEYGEADHEYPDDTLEYGEDDREYPNGWNEPDYQMEQEEDDQEYEEAEDQEFWLENDIHLEGPEQGGSPHRQGQSSSTPVDIEILLEDVMKDVDCLVKSIQVPWRCIGTINGSDLYERVEQNETEGASSSSPVMPDPDKEVRQSLGPKDSHLRPPGPNGSSCSHLRFPGPNGSSGSHLRPLGPNGSSGSHLRPPGPNGPSGSHLRLPGPNGPSGSHLRPPGPNGPSGSHLRPPGPNGPSGSHLRPPGPNGPS